MKLISNESSGICPKCGGGSLKYDWDAIIFNYDLMYVPFYCEDCHLIGNEVSSVEFIENEAWIDEV